MQEKCYTPLWICGLILAAAIGFFASSLIFSKDGSRDQPFPEAPQSQAAPEENADKPDCFDFSKRQMDSALGLTQEQISRMETNANVSDSARKAIHDKIKAAEKRLHTVLDADAIDEAALKSVRAELLLLNEQRLDSRIEDIKTFQSILTTDQKKIFKSLQPKLCLKHQNKGIAQRDGRKGPGKGNRSVQKEEFFENGPDDGAANFENDRHPPMGGPAMHSPQGRDRPEGQMPPAPRR